MLEQERSKTKNSLTKNADKSKRKVPKSEFEGREDKSALENAKALKHNYNQAQDKINERRKLEKQSIIKDKTQDNPNKV